MILTDEECDEFRRTQGSFNVMVRTIYLAGVRFGQDSILDALSEIKNDQTNTNINNDDTDN